MKDVTVLICSGVDGLSIFVSFSSWFNSRKFEYIFWKYWYKIFRLLVHVFLLHSKTKNEIHLPRQCKSHIVFGPLVFWDFCLCLKSLCSLSLTYSLLNILLLNNDLSSPVRFTLGTCLFTISFYLHSFVTSGHTASDTPVFRKKNSALHFPHSWFLYV